jgi:hypothetical protein
VTDFKYKQTEVKDKVAPIPIHYTMMVWGGEVEVKFQALTSALDSSSRAVVGRVLRPCGPNTCLSAWGRSVRPHVEALRSHAGHGLKA